MGFIESGAMRSGAFGVIKGNDQMSLLPTSGTFLAFLALVAGFGFIIFIHELGHFLAAKWVGIKVTQFAVGFGQSLLTFRRGLGWRVGTTEAEYAQRIKAHLAKAGRADHTPDATEERAIADELGLGETEYRLNWIPLGGYVKMLGQEDLKPGATSQDPRSFNAKPVGARAIVISAGVVMNLVSAVIFFIIAFSAGVAFPPAVAGLVIPGTPADVTYAQGHEGDAAYRGLQPGDRLIAINDKPMSDFMEVAVTSALSARGQQLNLAIERSGVEGPLVYPLVARPDVQTNLLSLGILPPQSLVLERLPLEGPQAQPRLKVPSAVVAVDGKPVSRFGDYYQAVASAKGRPVPVTFADLKDRSQTVTVDVSASPTLTTSADGQGPAHLIGLVPVTRVANVVDHSPSRQAGMQAGDLLAQVGPVAWPDPLTTRATIQAAKGSSVQVIVQRDGQRVDLGAITPTAEGTIGFYPVAALDVPMVAQTLPDSPAAASLQLMPGSTITQINGQPVADWSDMQRLLAQSAEAMDAKAGGQVNVGYRLQLAEGIAGQADVTLSADDLQPLTRAQWYPHLIDGFGDLREPVVAGSLWGAAALGVVKTKHYMQQTYVTLMRLFQGTVKPSHLRGPVGIAHEGTRVAKLGWTYLLFFLGLISVNLAVVNFLPIPVVDGGLMVFLLLEKLKGSPVSLRVQNVATIVGLALILSVFVITLFYDVSRLVS